VPKECIALLFQNWDSEWRSNVMMVKKRASEASLVALIQKLDLVDEQQAEILSSSKIKNHNQILVGEVKVRIP